MRVLPKVFAGFGKRRRNAGRFAPRFSPARRRMRGRFACWPPAVGRPGKNKIGVQQKSNSKAANLGDWAGGRKTRQAGMFFSGVRQVGRDASACWPPAGARGEKKRGGFLTHLDAAATYWRRRRAGRKTRPAGKFFRGFRNKAAECGAEGAAGFQPSPPAASSPSAKKKKGKADTDTSAATDIFGCAPARKSEHNARWRRLHFPSFRTAAAGQIADSANCWRNNPAEFFQKIFCGNFARAFFSKCFGPASPPPAKLPPSPLPKIRGGNSRGNFSPAPSAECRAPPPAAPATFPPVRGAAMRTALPSAPRRTFAVHLFAPAPPFGGGSGGEVGRPASGDGRDATFPAGCALLRRQRCTCAGNAARGMPDRLRGRVGARRGSVV